MTNDVKEAAMSKFYPPFIVIPLLVDEDGNGPVQVGDASRVVWEVWDAACQTFGTYETEFDAMNGLQLANSKHRGAGFQPWTNGR